MRGSAGNMLVAPGWLRPGLPGPVPGSRPCSWCPILAPPSWPPTCPPHPGTPSWRPILAPHPGPTTLAPPTLAPPSWPTHPGPPTPAPPSWRCRRAARWPAPVRPVFRKRRPRAPVVGCDLLLSLRGDFAWDHAPSSRKDRPRPKAPVTRRRRGCSGGDSGGGRSGHCPRAPH